MAATRTTSTRGLAVYEQLRSDILRGRHLPGAPLRLALLSEQFDVSMSVVREALVRLTERHLTVLTPNSGFRVSEVSRADLVDLTDLRVQIEGTAIERSVERGDIAWEAGVVAAFHTLERVPLFADDMAGTTDEWSAAHAAFHEELVSACGSPRLIALTRSLRDSAELYRQLSVGAHDSGRDVAGEHRQLLELALNRAGAEAAAALGRHLRCTTDMILRRGLD